MPQKLFLFDLFQHKLRFGCGCRPPLTCDFKNWEFVCLDPLEEAVEEATEEPESIEDGNLEEETLKDLFERRKSLNSNKL